MVHAVGHRRERRTSTASSARRCPTASRSPSPGLAIGHPFIGMWIATCDAARLGRSEPITACHCAGSPNPERETTPCDASCGKLIQLVVVFVVVTFFTVVPDLAGPGQARAGGDPVRRPGRSARRSARTSASTSRSSSSTSTGLSGFVHGDLGNYYRPSGKRPGRRPTSAAALPVSLLLMLYAQIALAASSPSRSGCSPPTEPGADRQGRRTPARSACIAIPNFALALVLSYYVGVKLRLGAPRGLHAHRRRARRPLQDHGRSRPSRSRSGRSRSTCGCCAAT